MTRRRALHELPVRVCRYGERCLICLGRIGVGERYRDGGHGRRAHLGCAADVAAGRRREPTRSEVRELEQAEGNVSRAKGKLYEAGIEDRGGSLTRAAAQLCVWAEERVERLKATWAQPEADGGC